MPSRKPGAKPAQRRQQLRDTLWPKADDIAWSRHTEKGWCTIPRTLPLVMTLIDHLSPKERGRASRVYHELWCRAYDEGFVELADGAEHAYAAGYTSQTRGVRSWRERVDTLAQLGFVMVKSKPTKKYGYVLIVHPDRAVGMLRKQDPKRIPDGWYQEYEKRMIEIGARKAGKP